jgi:molybdopterin molybdotransferase
MKIGHELTVLETVAAGVMPSAEVVPGTCSRIMTGAAVPAGADYVFMLEDSEEVTGGKVRFTGRPGNDNIAKAGEDIMKDQTVLRSGHIIKPQDIAVLASVGAMEVTVSCRPKVGVISTGNELVEPDRVPAGAQIRNSNSSQLLAQIARAGAKAGTTALPVMRQIQFKLPEKSPGRERCGAYLRRCLIRGF